MEAQDHREQASTGKDICRLEWIAWAIEAARRHKEESAAAERPLPPRQSLALKTGLDGV